MFRNLSIIQLKNHLLMLVILILFLGQKAVEVYWITGIRMFQDIETLKAYININFADHVQVLMWKFVIIGGHRKWLRCKNYFIEMGNDCESLPIFYFELFFMQRSFLAFQWQNSKVFRLFLDLNLPLKIVYLLKLVVNA